MKRSLALLLAAAVLLSGFQLISGSGISSKGDEENSLSACLLVPSEFGDKSLNDSARAGMERLREDYGIKLNTVECKNENYKQQLMTAAKENNIVAAVGWEFSEIKQVAAEYPNTRFIWIDNVVDEVEGSPNIVCVSYRQDEGAFLAGYIAAKLSQTNAVAVVGGEKESEVIRSYVNGFEQGARYANAGINVYSSYVGSYDDSVKAELCAGELHAKGADIILQLAGVGGNGVLEAAKNEGFYVIAVDQDQKTVPSSYDSVVLCTIKKDAGAAIYDVIAEYAQSEEWSGGRTLSVGVEDEYISVSYASKSPLRQVDEDTKRETAQLADKLAAGKLSVKSDR